jgi:hypothetical protein
MAVTTVLMGAMLLLEERGLLSSPQDVCDFGSMEFDAREPSANPVFEALLRARAGDVPAAFYDAENGRMHGIAGDYWRALGWTYTSYDIDGRFGSKVLDLNVDHAPEADRGKFSLTMNGGTSEHVFNQYNFFLQFHDVTRVGGLMVHVVPFHLVHNHGLYQYSPTFFHSLAQYNGYEPLGLWQCGKPHYHLYRSSFARPEGRRVALVSVMRRTRPDDFVFPLQVNEPMVISPEVEERYGSFSTQALETFRRSGGLPEEFYVDIPTATVHEGPIPKKLFKAAQQDVEGKKQGVAGKKKAKKKTPRRARRLPLLRR